MTLDYSVQFICDISSSHFRKKQIKMPCEVRNKITPSQVKNYMKVVYINKALVF